MKKAKGIIFALISSATFGLIPFFSIPLLKTGMHAPSILFYRSIFSAIIIGILCLIRKKSLSVSRKAAVQLFFLSMFYTATAMGLIYSYSYISSGVSTTIHFLYPIVVTSLMILFFKEKKSLTTFIAGILSLAGVALLCWNENGFINIKGLIAALLTVFTYASYIVNLNRVEIKKLETETVIFYVMFFGAIIFSLFSHFTTGIELISDVEAWFNLGGLVLFATILSIFTLLLAVKNVGSTVTSILGSMEPAVAMFVGILYFSEPYGWNTFGGLILIILSVGIVITNRKRMQNIAN